VSFYGLIKNKLLKRAEVEEEVTEIEDPIAAGEEFVQNHVSAVMVMRHKVQKVGPALDAA